MRIDCPWPDSRLMPNAKRRLHWGAYAPVAKQERELARILACAAIPHDKRAEIALEGEIRLKLTFSPPDRRKRDDDGMIGAFKHQRDGIADAFRVDDNVFRCTYEFVEPAKPGSVVVEVLR